MRRWLLDPHVALALGAAGGWRRDRLPGSDLRRLAPARACAAGRSWSPGAARTACGAPLLALAIGFQLAYLGVHYVVEVEGDIDSSLVFRWQGNAILDGYYPRS